jgi:hypothetical protein
MDEQPGPDLPPDGVGIIPEEICKLKGLLDFFKEDLDIPRGSVELDSRGFGSRVARLLRPRHEWPF